MGGGGGGRLIEAGRLLTFSAFRMGAYTRWALIRGWALIRINTILGFLRQFAKYKPPGGLYLKGRFNGGFFALPVLEGLIFGILRYVKC